MAKTTIRARLREGKQTEWAQRLGLSQGYVSLLLAGKREPSLGQLCAIADIMGVSDRELGASAREMVSSSAPVPPDCDPPAGEPVADDDVPGMVSAFGTIFGLRARRK